MKTPFEWAESDLQSLVKERVIEDLHLEYKDGRALMDSKKDEISKDVSAFANADGGTIIYGISENSNHEPEYIGGVDPSDKSHEWLEQIIHSRIQPIIPTIKIRTIKLSTLQGRVVYIVHVPKGNIAHQASDKKFYRRRNFSCDPMHAYEINELNNRSIAPKIEIDFRLEDCKDSSEDHTIKFPNNIQKNLIISIGNDGSTMVEHCMVRIFIDRKIEILGLDRDSTVLVDDLAFTYKSKEYRTKLFLVKWSVPAKLPIWDGEKFTLTDKPIPVSIPKIEDEYLFVWQASAPSMKKKNCCSILKANQDFLFTEKEYFEKL